MTVVAGSTSVPVSSVDVAAYTVPTDGPESDGTIAWDSTTAVVVTVRAGDSWGVGYTYADTACAEMVKGKLGPLVTGSDVLQPVKAWEDMVAAVRNLGRAGIAGMAISAVDIALWDCKARLLGVPLTVLLGGASETSPIYGSGGFTSYDDHRLAEQLSGWVADGIPRVKMKVGRRPGEDRHRLEVARSAIGEAVELFVDANGAYGRAQALEWAAVYGDFGVRWFEEPVTSDDLEGLRMVRGGAPGGMDVACGEYGWNLFDFRRWLEAGAVDCLQVDVTRCGGITGFLGAAALAASHSIDVSAHCAPQVSARVGTAVPRFRHLEYFHDHVRIEHMLFDGVLEPEAGGLLRPDRDRPGMGLQLKERDARRWAA